MSCCGGAAEFSEVGGEVLARLIAFVRTLRDDAFAIGLKETQDAAKVVASELAARPSLLRSALKALFCARAADWRKFDEIFDAHWLGRGVKRLTVVGTAHASTSLKTVRDMMVSDRKMDAETAPVEQISANDNTGGESPASSGQSRMEGASRIATLSQSDFRKISNPEALAEAHALAERLARAMRSRLTRRDRARRRGCKIDLRRTIRRNIAHGGVPIELVHRMPKPKPLRLVVLLDASGSMSLYVTVFVRFIHGVLEHFRESEAFLFHTHLAHVTPAMRDRDGTRALDRLGLLAGGVGGGTRIGESLATFNRWYAKRMIHSRTCVMILSDGYETGDARLLGAEMAQLAKRCRRIVWLNPMLGWEGYAPTARGMQAALDYVDLFAPAHTLDSLRKLEPYLARL